MPAALQPSAPKIGCAKARDLWDFGVHGILQYIPAWLLDRDSEHMRINEQTRKTVVFVGIVDDTGAFAPYGTGFIVIWPDENGYFTYLITARHVIDAIQSTGRQIVGRINSKGGTAELGALASHESWASHPTIPKCDIAVSEFSASYETFDIKGINVRSNILTDEYIAAHDIGPGTPVFTAGLLVPHFGKSKNIPIVRSGNIAAMPEEPIDLGSFGHQEVYLIESRSIGGLSGSPVFIYADPFRLLAGTLVGEGDLRTEHLLGVNIGLFETKAAGDRLPSDAEDLRERALDTMSAGIAIVVPIQRGIEIISDDPSMIDRRKKEIEKRTNRSGFRMSAAGAHHRLPEERDDSDIQ